MKRLIAVLFGLFIVMSIGSAPASAQSVTACELGQYWLVADHTWTGVWIRQGQSPVFDARWSMPGKEDIEATMTIQLDGVSVIADRVDTPNKSLFKTCHYRGTIESDGVSVGGSVDCTLETGDVITYPWSATIACGSSIIEWGMGTGRFGAAKHSTFDFFCPPHGTAAPIWGTGVYMDDSSICTAAVHAGLITLVDGGPVSLEILEGQSSYEGSSSHDVTSTSYGEWPSSYRFVDTRTAIPRITWNENAARFRGMNGQRYTFECLANGHLGAVVGTGLYTDDSPICIAAVHAGVIGIGGGDVTIEILPGATSYTGSTSSDVTSLDYGPWEGSYQFV